MFSTIVLAGGQSSRMGTDKARLTIAGQPLWQRQVALAQQLGCVDIHVSHAQFGHPDRVPGWGPLSGLDTLLPVCRHAQVLVLAVDMPYLQADGLHPLLSNRGNHAVHYQDSVLPCVLYNSAALQDYVRQQLHAQGQRSVQRLLQHLGAQAIVCAQPQQLINTNTPLEWLRAQQQQSAAEAL